MRHSGVMKCWMPLFKAGKDLRVNDPDREPGVIPDAANALK